MTRTIKFFALVLMFLGLASGKTAVQAETPDGVAASPHEIAETPVAEVRNAKSWEYGPFVNLGKGVGDRSSYDFLWAGFQVAKPLTPVLHAGILSGQFELGANIMPFWQAYTPKAHANLNGKCTEIVAGVPTVVPCTLFMGGGTFTGVSLTPVVMRWNFLTHSRRFQPWFQAAGGLVYTTHKFPPNIMAAQVGNGPVTIANPCLGTSRE